MQGQVMDRASETKASEASKVNQDYTYLVMVVDRSGSMASVKRDMEGAISTFLEDQKKVDGKCDVKVCYFNDTYTAGEKVSLADISNIEIKPAGMTALIDALGKTIDEVGNDLATMETSKRPGLVQFVTITDGEENASKEYTRSQIAEKIRHQSDVYNWDFLFLGTNQDAVLNAKQLGYTSGKAFTYDNTTKGIGDMSRGLTDYTISNRMKTGAGGAALCKGTNFKID